MNRRLPFVGIILFFCGIFIGFHIQCPRLGCAPCSKNINITTTPSTSQKQSQTALVTKVIDGDTIKLDTGETVRYIGMDTPELTGSNVSVKCFGKEAKEKNQEIVEGKTVELQKDVSETDRYGRLLRYVFVKQDNATTEALFVNKYLVEEGYASVATFPPDVQYADEFLLLQKKAMEEKKGLWNMCR